MKNKKNTGTDAVSIDYQAVIEKLEAQLLEQKKQINALFTMFYGVAQERNFPFETETVSKNQQIGFRIGGGL